MRTDRYYTALRDVYSAKELAEKVGVSTRTIQRVTSKTWAEYLEETSAHREAIRAFHDDQGHSWSETADHFHLHVDTCRNHARRARREQAEEAQRAEAEASVRIQPPLLGMA